MRVDQTRHQSAAAEVDRLSDRARDRPVRHLPYPTTLHQDMMVFAALVTSAVEHRAIGKNERGHYTLFSARKIRPDCHAGESGDGALEDISYGRPGRKSGRDQGAPVPSAGS